MEENEFKRRLGAHIRSLREAVGLEQIELAHRCNFEKQAMSRIEKGGTNPTILTLKKIAEALEVPLSRLVDFS